MTVLFFAVRGPKFIKSRDDVGALRSFPRCVLIVSIVFLAGDIGAQICH